MKNKRFSRSRRAGGYSTIILLVLLGASLLVLPGTKELIKLADWKPGVFSSVQDDSVLLRLNEIKSSFRVIAAEENSEVILSGFSESWVPYSRTDLQYQAVFEARAIIDLRSLPDGAIFAKDNVVFITSLPEPILEARLNTGVSRVLNEDRQILSAFAHDKDLQSKIQHSAQEKVIQLLEEDGELLEQAKLSAKEELERIFSAAGFDVVFLDRG
ncbi:DUF4230 domain-containing protein [bacterium]|nr:DUF4230 domain-containing protein [bacterium]